MFGTIKTTRGCVQYMSTCFRSLTHDIHILKSISVFVCLIQQIVILLQNKTDCVAKQKAKQ